MLNTVTKKKSMKVIIIAIIGLLVILSSFLVYYLTLPEEVAEYTYQTGKVKQGDLSITVENSGVIQYAEQSELNSTVNGTINQLYIGEKSNVAIGDPILAVDDSSLRIQLDQAYNDLQVAQLKLADLLQTTVGNTSNVSVKDLTVVTSPIDGFVQHSAQEGMYVTTNNSLMKVVDNQKFYFLVSFPEYLMDTISVGDDINIITENNESGFNGVVSKINNKSYYNNSELVYDVWIEVNNSNLTDGTVGEINLNYQDELISLKGKFINYAEASVFPKVNGRVDDIYVRSGQYVTKGTPLFKLDDTALINQIETQKKSIDNLELKIEQLQLELEKSIVKSPVEGKIEELYVAENQAIANNTKIAKVVSNDLVANIEIDELDIGKIKLGQEANLFIPGYSEEEVKGVVSYISNTGIVKDGITTYSVYISFEPNEQIKSGMTVDASIMIEKAENVLMVPTTSIVDIKGGKGVRYIVGDKIDVKKVEVGISNDTMTQIISGLELTDTIITSFTYTNTSTTSDGPTSSSLIPTSVNVPGINGGPGGGTGSGK